MKQSLCAFLVIAGACLSAAAVRLDPQDPAKEQLKSTLKDVDTPSSWVYDDVNAGFAEAKKSGKPMLVVFR